jgi:hypothetical protein
MILLDGAAEGLAPWWVASPKPIDQTRIRFVGFRYVHRPLRRSRDYADRHPSLLRVKRALQ